ncbi:centrosome and spindle pole-associated protein 1 isoform X2 [Esox lucius]|uniref:centrosome and spindle pole-associated protein 1 isoform X2 n=1 Tax=Esox lucius TaxID=8010 RepID=UPI00147695F1|nr:centrosome and spindle pole-associated protein 1 isoform X2 [Esox lucius]
MGNLDNFLEDQKEPSQESACLEEEDLPYMTIKTKTIRVNPVKENDAPFDWTSTPRRLQTLGKDESSGLSLQLGAEYEQKKQKLQEELRSEYRRFVAQDKLRDERNKEYNLFLKGWSGQTSRRSSKPAQFQAPEFQAPAAPNSHPAIPEAQISRPWDPLPPKKDAATLTDGGTGPEGRGPRGRRRWDLQRLEESLEHWESRRPRRRSRHREYSSEEYLSTEEEEFEFLDRRRQRRSRKPESPERRERRVTDRPAKATRGRRGVEPAVVHDDDTQDQIRTFQSATPKPKSLVTPVAMKTVERSRSEADMDRGVFATGLMIGTAEEDAARDRRKERYRQELLEQMAEGRRNKKKEKDLELRVAATGAVDPEKQPDRIKQFGAVNRGDEGQRRDIQHRPGVSLDALGSDCKPWPRQQRRDTGTEESLPPERPRVAFPSLPVTDALGRLPGADVAPLHKDFPRSLSSTLGEMIAPRIADLPPPLPPTLTDAYRTPYDEAYYCYGARNPRDLNPSHYGPPVSGGQTLLFPYQPPGMMLLPGHQGARTNQHPVALPEPGLGVGPIGKRPKQSKESVLNYQEALRQQIKEKESRQREEREASDRYNAKIEEESKAFDPWGKGGGGAPLRDDNGNLISDLNRMHRTNEEAYANPESRDRGKPRVSVARSEGGGGGGGRIPTGEEAFPSGQQLSGFSQPSQFARGNMFSDQRTLQKLQDQGTYKDFLKQQIDDKRRREAEERDRKRMEEEREEKRVAEQRVCIQKEFEEEQDRKRRKEVEQMTKNEELIRQAEERRREADRKRREEEERENESLRKQMERERQALKADRANSPIIPALQKKLYKHLTPRPPSATSQFSSRALSGGSVSAPHSPPVPARRNQLRATEERPEGVIRGLSTLRRRLRSEQRRLEGQLLQRDRKDKDTPLPDRHGGHPRSDVFQVARVGARGLSRRVAARVNKQNVRESDPLKHRDYEPSGIQQPRRHARENPGHQRVHSLESESTFIDYPDGDAGSLSPAQVDPRTRQPAVRESWRPVRRRDLPEVGVTAGGQRGHSFQPDGRSLFPVTSLNVDEVGDRNQRRVRGPQDFSEHDGRSDKGDDLSLRSTPFHPDRRVSIETVATEPWLRPGTSDTQKWFGAGQIRREAGY